MEERGHAEVWRENIYLHGHGNIFHNFWYIRFHFVFGLPSTPYKAVVVHSKLPNEEEGLTEAISAPCIDALLNVQVLEIKHNNNYTAEDVTYLPCCCKSMA
jgi:hypothetical protein